MRRELVVETGLEDVWHLGGLEGPTLTQGELTLEDLAALRISAEFGTVIAETTYLDSVSFGSSCVGDLDGSGDVVFSDLLRILSAWGPCAGCPEGLDRSGDVGFSDVLFVLSSWGALPVRRSAR